MMMMMMMKVVVVSLSEHAKQPLSLPLLPKVFFSPFSQPLHPVVLTPRPSSCEQCVISTHPLNSTVSLHLCIFFLILHFPDFLSLCVLALFGSTPTSCRSFWHWYCDCVVVTWFYGLCWTLWWCAAISVKVWVGVHPLGSCSLLFDCILLLQLVVNHTRYSHQLFLHNKASF